MSNTFDAGSIESRLVLDRSDFTDGLREAKTEGENFARQKFEATIGVDARGVTTTIASIKAELASLKNVNLNIGVSGSNAQIRAISQSASALDGRNIGLSVNVAGIADASAQLRTLRQQVNALDGRTINIRADVDTAAALTQIAALRTALNGIPSSTNTVTNSSGNMSKMFAGHMMDIVAAAMLAAPAIFPLTNAALGAAGAFTTMGVAVAGAVGIFGAATVGAVMNVSKLNKELDKAKANLATQKAALDRLTPGTDAYALQLKKCEEAQKQLTAAQKAFNPVQKQTADAMVAVKGAWADFVKATENSTLPVVTNFLLTAKDALPRLVPAVKAMAPEFGAIGRDLRSWVNDGGLERFVDFVIATGVPAFRNLRLAGANLATVFGNLFRAFSGGARTMASGIVGVTGAMAKWSNQGGFERFIDKVHDEAPMVREFFKQLWDALKNVHAALEPLGPLGMGFVTMLLKIIAVMPPWLIQTMYLGFIAWRAAVLGIAAATAIWAAAQFVLDTAMSPFFLLMAGAALTIIGVVAAIAALAAGIYFLVKYWDTVKAALVTAWNATWNAIKIAASAVYNTVLKPTFDAIMIGLRAIGTAAMWLWTNAIKPAFNFISIGARLLVVIIGTILITPIYLLIKALGALFGWLWKVAIKPAFDSIADGARWLYRSAIQPAMNGIMTAVRAVGTAAKWTYTNGIKPAFDWIADKAKWMWAQAKTAFNLTVAGLKLIGKWATWLYKNAIKPAFDSTVDAAKWLWTHGIKPVVGWITDGFKTLGKWAKWLWDKGIKPQWDAISTGTGKLKDGMIKIFDKMKDGIGKVWNAVKKIAAVPINFVIDTVYNGGIVKVWNKIASAVGLDKMKLGTVSKIKYAHGGAGPVSGGTAGMDSVNARLMPGEHVWTADEVRNAGGHQAMAAMRSAFSSTGKARVAPGAGYATDYSKGSGQGYFLGGGIIDWGKDTLSDAAGGLKNAWDATGGKVVSAAWDKLKDVTRGAIGTVANPILNSIKGGVAKGVGGVIPGHPAWEDLAVGTATKPINMMIDWINADDAKNSVGGANVGKALDWARTQAGKPYVWGGVGPHGYDCSGFMSAIQNVIDGRSPYNRRWATGAFPPGAKGWKRNEKDPFTVGITNAGVGHTAGTLGGVNVESRGGKGVIVGSGARGAKDSLFTSQWGYTPSKDSGGGSGRWAETVTAVLRELNKYSTGNVSDVLKAIQKESGGNPNAINLTDSNAKAGHPSKGLLQTIDSTFNAYAGKYKSKGVYDPYANIYAAVRYASSTYGSGWAARMARPGGYKLGGPMVPGLSIVGEAGPELVASDGSHRVISASETQRLIRQAGGGRSGGGMAVIPASLTVKIGEREFLAMLDDETRATLADMIKEAEGSR